MLLETVTNSPPWPKLLPLWRTHSCVQRSHSCERVRVGPTPWSARVPLDPLFAQTQKLRPHQEQNVLP
jgi:hypothetical protein